MFVNRIKSYREIVAICDSEIIGKTFEEGKLQLYIKETFYKGQEFSEEQVKEIMEDMLREDATFNIAGEKSVRLALQVGIVTEEGVGRIGGVPFAIVLL